MESVVSVCAYPNGNVPNVVKDEETLDCIDKTGVERERTWRMKGLLRGGDAVMSRRLSRADADRGGAAEPWGH
jgi:hypothetical protein